jgi:isopentenyl-diphosphate Delta-isomerase
MEQHVILVNQQDEIMGFEEKLKAHQQGLLHRAFSILIFNDQRELLLQQRAKTKYHSGGLWTNTCCSHHVYEEDIEDTVCKRLKFEMGFDCRLNYGFTFSYQARLDKGLIENELDHVYYGFYNEKPIINPQEAMNYRWASIDTLRKEYRSTPEKFTAWFPFILEKM